MNPTDLYPEMLHPYDPRFKPLPPPTVDVCAAPVHNICVNAEWWSHISGMISRLAYRDAWSGTDDEISDAIESISKILNVGKPTMGCGCGSKTTNRYSPDGVYQISNDGGATWIDAPELDPRHNISILPPLTGAAPSDVKCKSANSMVAYLKEMQEEYHQKKVDEANSAEIGVIIVGFLAAVGIIATGGALVLLGTAIAALLANQTADDFNNAFTDGFWNDVICALYCQMDDEGRITDAGQLNASEEILADYNDIAGNWLDGVLNAFGGDGITNVGRLGINGSLVCSGCDCDDTCWTDWVTIPQNPGTTAWGTVLSKIGNDMTLQATEVATGQYRIMVANLAGDNCHTWTYSITTAGVYGMPCGYATPLDFVYNLGADSIAPTLMNGGGLFADGSPFTVTLTCTG